MTRFIQLHLLTSYPPANLNRDDLGRPKTAVMGGCQRLRVSSQSLKRAWRTSEVFKTALEGHIGTRTKAKGLQVFESLKTKGIADTDARAWADKIAGVFGKLKKEGLEIEQLAHFSPEEERAIEDLVGRLGESKQPPTDDDLKLLRKDHSGADIAMFGRMLANATNFNMEAAIQVAHAITVHEAAVEDDYFTAVDDLNKGDEDLGAGHLGEAEFAAGLFYTYICIDHGLLQRNLGDTNKQLATKALGALIEAAATIAPRGKQASFASRAYASYILIEKGERQPRSLSVAFLKPVSGRNMLADAIQALEETRVKIDKAYGPCDPVSKTMNVLSGKGTLKDIVAYALQE